MVVPFPRWIAALFAAAVLMGAGELVGCASKIPPTVVTPQGKAAYTADQVVIRVNELQNAAIQAEASGALPTSTTRVIVTFCVAADKTLATVPNGWQQTIATAWTQAKQQIPAKDLANTVISAAVAGIDVVIAAFGGN
jgi:hypothetical protein